MGMGMGRRRRRRRRRRSRGHGAAQSCAWPSPESFVVEAMDSSKLELGPLRLSLAAGSRNGGSIDVLRVCVPPCPSQRSASLYCPMFSIALY